MRESGAKANMHAIHTGQSGHEDLGTLLHTSSLPYLLAHVLEGLLVRQPDLQNQMNL